VSSGGAGIGVLAMAYGTPASPDEIEAYYTHIRRGRPPTGELLAELRGRYEAIGGSSPLLEITQAQVRVLRDALAQAGFGDVRVALGMKHAPPFIEDGVAELIAAGAQRIVGVVLAPHYSRMSVGEYEERARAAACAAPEPPEVVVVHNWHLEADYLRLVARAVGDALARLPGELSDDARVLFTAHSLPERILTTGDPYVEQLGETAAAVASLAGIEHWGIAWQSAGRTADPWIGPDVLDAMTELVAQGVEAVVVCPAGFVSDHLEVLYDLDVEAAARAQELGIAFERTASPNASPELAQAIVAALRSHLVAQP
jgi:protoporphyrin/coproporphyrin ferrochelatase